VNTPILAASMAGDPVHLSLVETLRFAVPTYIAEFRDAGPADLMRAGRAAALLVGERGDVLTFSGRKEHTASQRSSVALAFNGLARGLGALAYNPGGITFAGLHWCTAAHDDCPTPPRTPGLGVTREQAAHAIGQLDEYAALAGHDPRPTATKPGPRAPTVPARRTTADPHPSPEWSHAL
jgi:hypothetical protein